MRLAILLFVVVQTLCFSSIAFADGCKRVTATQLKEKAKTEVKARGLTEKIERIYVHSRPDGWGITVLFDSKKPGSYVRLSYSFCGDLIGFELGK